MIEKNSCAWFSEKLYLPVEFIDVTNVVLYLQRETGCLKKLNTGFYQRPNVVQTARELLGRVLVTRINGIVTSGRIVETEAYEGTGDRASHASRGKRGGRCEVMYAAGGGCLCLSVLRHALHV